MPHRDRYSRISGREASSVILSGAAFGAVDTDIYVSHNEVYGLAIRFSASASRHGISHERARFVVEQCPSPICAPATGPPNAVLFLGPDGEGVPLEVLATELVDGELLVFHAMRMRRRYQAEYEWVMRWHER